MNGTEHESYIMKNNVDVKKCLKQAEKVIKENSITSPPIPVVDIANSYGLIVEEDNLMGDAGKLFFKENKIVINENDQIPRRRFTIAHELGHFLMHRNLAEFQKKECIERSMPILAEEKEWYEKEADYFAANILVPFDFLKDCIEKNKDKADFLTENRIYFLAEKFNVSPTMMHFRIKNYEQYSN